MQPVRQLLGNTRTILFSPDAALNLIPFGALVDENNQYLVENYHITYLTSGRDLLRIKDKFASQQPPIIMADPSYGKEGEKVALTRSIDLSEFTFSRLPGTEEEAKAIKNLLPQAINCLNWFSSHRKRPQTSQKTEHSPHRYSWFLPTRKNQE
jgi:CHAT domain-containing protein